MLGVGQHRRLLCARIFQIEQMRNTGALFLGAALRVAIVVDAICASTSSTRACSCLIVIDAFSAFLAYFRQNDRRTTASGPQDAQHLGYTANTPHS